MKKDVRRGSGVRAGANDSEKTLPKMCGAVCVQYRDYKGKRLGPYYFLMWRERGKLRKRYIKRGDVEAVRAACAAHRDERRRRESHAEVMRWIRDFNRTFRETERLLKLARLLR